MSIGWAGADRRIQGWGRHPSAANAGNAALPRQTGKAWPAAPSWRQVWRGAGRCTMGRQLMHAHLSVQHCWLSRPYIPHHSPDGQRPALRHGAECEGMGVEEPVPRDGGAGVGGLIGQWHGGWSRWRCSGGGAVQLCHAPAWGQPAEDAAQQNGSAGAHGGGSVAGRGGFVEGRIARAPAATRSGQRSHHQRGAPPSPGGLCLRSLIHMSTESDKVGARRAEGRGSKVHPGRCSAPSRHA